MVEGYISRYFSMSIQYFATSKFGLLAHADMAALVFTSTTDAEAAAAVPLAVIFGCDTGVAA